MNMVVTVTGMNFHHFVVVQTQCNARTNEVFGKENVKSGCRKKMRPIGVDVSVSVMETFVSR